MKNDIEPFDKSLIDIASIKNHEKFINFYEIVHYDKMKNKYLHTNTYEPEENYSRIFSSSDLLKKRLSKKEMQKSLKNMKKYFEMYKKNNPKLFKQANEEDSSSS